jgi:hypothetical protein
MPKATIDIQHINGVNERDKTVERRVKYAQMMTGRLM